VNGVVIVRKPAFDVLIKVKEEGSGLWAFDEA
jgi:hypothetical protein